MGLIKGDLLRLVAILLYFLAFICSIYIMAATAWFLARFHYFPAHKRNYAIIGMSAIATLYTSIAMLLTCCLGVIGFFAVSGFLLNVIFVGVMIAIAILTRSARHGCDDIRRFRSNPFGAGSYAISAGLDPGHSTCRIYVATFALAITGVFAFYAAAAVSLLLFRDGQRQRVMVVEKEPRRNLFKRRHKPSHEVERTNAESAREV
ncbi:hypothetical protein DOTSEDRAFT_124142 [Dothistroma septosporum NZE10]|uniref:MARVEL domain-containing protein n=1 Tax=Dothistroma septosporum (strain NZE10 / CBS 128990) TaxID=675120 RepID=N1PX85_DOTSN|nr:hypothetical protein DOTSEDRAFT_124142 [Dothistroma septosporum NZE10]